MEYLLLALIAVIIFLFLYGAMMTYKLFSKKEQKAYQEDYNKINRKIDDVHRRLNEVRRRDVSCIDVDIEEDAGYLEESRR